MQMQQLVISRQLMSSVLAHFVQPEPAKSDTEVIVSQLRSILSAEINAPTLHVACLGNLRVAGDGGWHLGPQPKRGGEFIAYMVLHQNHAVSVERLAETLWPGLPPEMVTHRLHIAASGARVFLRQLLGGTDAIRCTSDGYSWNPALRVASDIDRFIDLYKENSIDSLTEAVSVYTGDLFAGDRSDWLQPARVKYATMYSATLERLAENAFACGSFDAALNLGLDLLAIDRAHESASRLVMRCFGALGRRSQALAEYQSLRAYLQKHLGTSPMPETTAAIRGLVSQL
jgi:DNA-binding SARP family transcriptional activator